MGQNWIGVTCGKAERYVVEIEGLCGKKAGRKHEKHDNFLNVGRLVSD